MPKYDIRRIKESLTVEDVKNLLTALDGDPYMVNDHEVVSRTICHNGESHKLHYYDNSKLFQCYTECEEPFDVFELVKRVNGFHSFSQSVGFIVDFFNLYSFEDFQEDDPSLDVFKDYEEREEDMSSSDAPLVLPTYDDSVLDNLPMAEDIGEWKNQHISNDVCVANNIRLDSVSGSIVIPHYNIGGNCIGIRRRTLREDEMAYGKYRPWRHGTKLYNHPLGLTLYGIDKARDGIERAQRVVVVEGEKGVLQFQSYYGSGIDNCCVAVCGSSITKRQFKILFDLGITELIIAFDRDFKGGVYSNEYYDVKRHFENIGSKFRSYVNVSYIMDDEGLLNYKDSPLDQGKAAFEQLFKTRRHM